MAEKYWSEQPCSNYHGIQSCSRKFCGNSVVEQGEEWRNMTEDPLNFVTVTPVVCLAVFWSLEFTVYWAMLYCVPHPSCLWALCGEYRRMNVISQSGAVELHVSILRMCLFRMGPREGLLATAMKKKKMQIWWPVMGARGASGSCYREINTYIDQDHFGNCWIMDNTYMRCHSSDIFCESSVWKSDRSFLFEKSSYWTLNLR